MYKLVDLLRIALGIRIEDNSDLYKGRFLYWLAQLDPGASVNTTQRETYQKFRETLYQWFMDDNQNHHKRALLTAILILVYSSRS